MKTILPYAKTLHYITNLMVRGILTSKIVERETQKALYRKKEKGVMAATYSTSQIAKSIGIHPNTVRLYGKMGLITQPKREATPRR